MNIIKKEIKLKKLIEILILITIFSLPFIFLKDLTLKSKIEIENIENSILYTLPEENGEEIILNYLDLAEKKVNINIYLLSNKSIIKKIKNLAKKDIKINIILEKEPFGGGYLNYKTTAELSGLKNIEIRNILNIYSLNHAKYIVIDEKVAIIMTSNLTGSGLNSSRDFIFVTKDKNITENLNNLFKKDFKVQYLWERKIPENLVISPINSRKTFEMLIKNAKYSLELYAENFNDERIINLLNQKSEEGVKIKIILSESISSNKSIIKKFHKNIKTGFIKKPYQHSKVIIMDKKILYIGSVNFSMQSMDQNREVGIILKEKEFIEKIWNVFYKDWNNNLSIKIIINNFVSYIHSSFTSFSTFFNQNNESKFGIFIRTKTYKPSII
jgi:phosphatidylserine/phosphatidylglycerophosphate/cardiolipin synthase-like enzyme